MPQILTGDGTKVWMLRDRRTQFMRWGAWFVGALVFLWCWKVISDATEWFFVYDAPRIAADIGGRAMPPRWSYMEKLWEPLWDTINIATLGTFFALAWPQVTLILIVIFATVILSEWVSAKVRSAII